MMTIEVTNLDGVTQNIVINSTDNILQSIRRQVRPNEKRYSVYFGDEIVSEGESAEDHGIEDGARLAIGPPPK